MSHVDSMPSSAVTGAGAPKPCAGRAAPARGTLPPALTRLACMRLLDVGGSTDTRPVPCMLAPRATCAPFMPAWPSAMQSLNQPPFRPLYRPSVRCAPCWAPSPHLPCSRRCTSAWPPGAAATATAQAWTQQWSACARCGPCWRACWQSLPRRCSTRRCVGFAMLPVLPWWPAGGPAGAVFGGVQASPFVC